MQRLQRVKQAKKQLERKTRIQKEDFERREIKRSVKYNQTQFEAPRLRLLSAERKQRREDWELGNLAPRHDASIEDGKYGTVDSFTYMYGKVHPTRVKRHFIYEGDRVVVLKGPNKGQIGEVQTIQEDRNSISITNIGKLNLRLDEWQQEISGAKDPVIQTERYFKIDDVRLVFKHRGRDVIAEKLEGKVNKGVETRYIPGTGILVPKPHALKKLEKEDKDTSKNVEHDADTSRMDVENRTYFPDLDNAPLPSGVIDELRNKYSKLRTRSELHSKPPSVERKADALTAADPLMMRTPLDEIRLQRKKQREARPAPGLNNDMLAKMGALLAEKATR